ncbi:BrnT family toxin [Ruegeria jejuensis]|uniref:BrnT family toxin n=1 Tax=Ruegeria jejuensis TaxID=3233338 RepID=UPI00355BCD14
MKERGLDFADVAHAVWSQALTIEDTRSDYAEPRFVTIAPIHERICVFAWCWRGQNMRIISLRKANAREVKRYGQSSRT